MLWGMSLRLLDIQRLCGPWAASLKECCSRQGVCLHNLLHASHMCGQFGRPRLAIQRTMLKAMIAHDGMPSHTALWLIAYIWLLRLPSEALPMCVCASEPQRGVHQSAVWREGDNICVLLSSRKNLQGGSGVLRRACSCGDSPHMCPVHVLWE